MNDGNSIITSEYPWVAFRLKQQNYCITSQYVLQMVIQSELTPMPKSPDFVLGVLNLRGDIYPVVDLRILLGFNTLRSEIDAFGAMKDKHLAWVTTLQKCVEENTAFTLARDPHKCSFGLWYDNFNTISTSVNFILECIKEPHNEMHHQAEIIDKCRANGDMAGIQSALSLAQDLCYEKIVPLLDDLIEAYSAACRGMIILVQKGDTKLGLLVDSISSIEGFEGGYIDNLPLKMESDKNVSSLIVSKDGNLYLEINIDALADITKGL